MVHQTILRQKLTHDHAGSVVPTAQSARWGDCWGVPLPTARFLSSCDAFVSDLSLATLGSSYAPSAGSFRDTGPLASFVAAPEDRAALMELVRPTDPCCHYRWKPGCCAGVDEVTACDNVAACAAVNNDENDLNDEKDQDDGDGDGDGDDDSGRVTRAVRPGSGHQLALQTMTATV